jgi:hypothetical protein
MYCTAIFFGQDIHILDIHTHYMATTTTTSLSAICQIDDTRPIGAFTKITFSGYKTAQAMKKLLETLTTAKVEGACYWTAELICSGHYAELWEIIFLFYGKHVHVANPKLAIYIETKLDRFKENMNNASSAQAQLNFRNDPAFRNMFCELIITLCFSDKKFTIQYTNVPDEDFDLVVLKNNLVAPDFARAESIIQPEDPRELLVTINELQFCLSVEVASTMRANYWIEWLIDYAKLCKKRKQPCLIQQRTHDIVETKHQRNIVWLIWDAIQRETKLRRSSVLTKIIDALFRMFALRYSEAHNTRRKCIIYFAVALLTMCPHGTVEKIPMVRDKAHIVCAVAQTDAIFAQVCSASVNTQAETHMSAGGTTTSEDKMRTISLFENTKRMQTDT